MAARLRCRRHAAPKKRELTRCQGFAGIAQHAQDESSLKTSERYPMGAATDDGDICHCPISIAKGAASDLFCGSPALGVKRKPESRTHVAPC
jgi:hypothetical protein